MSATPRPAEPAATTPDAPGGTRSGARRGVVEIVLGAGLGQGLLVLASPLLSRLYDPADFAVLQIFTGVVSVVAVIASLRLELALPMARTGHEARAVLRVGLLATAVVAALTFVVGWGTSGLWARDETLRTLASMWWLVPLTVAVIAAFQLVSAVLVRAERYRDLAVRNAAQGVGTTVAQIGLGLLAVTPLGLLLGLGLGRALGLVSVLGRRGPKELGEDADRPVRTPDLRAALVRFRRFPLLTTWSALLNNAAQYAPFLVFSLTYGANPTGWLAFTGRLLAMPITVIGQAVAQVYLGRGAAATRDRSGDLPRLTWLAVRRLTLLGLVPAGLLAWLGPWAFGLVFGDSWERAGVYAQLLALAFLAQFVAAPIAHVFNLTERQGVAVVWDGVRLVLVVVAPWLVWTLGGSDLMAVAAYAGALFLSYVGVLVLARWVLRRA